MAHDAAQVGRRIALLRQRLRLSQVAFARQAGISRNSLLVYERGERVPKTAILARIADAGGVSPRTVEIEGAPRSWVSLD